MVRGHFAIRAEGRVSFGMLVWSTGIAPTPLLKGLKGVKQDEKTRKCVRPRSSIADGQLHRRRAAPRPARGRHGDAERLRDRRPEHARKRQAAARRRGGGSAGLGASRVS